MAARSLGTLTLDIIAKVGGFEAGMGKAEREAEKRSRAIAKVVNEAAALGIKAFGALAAAGVAAFGIINRQAENIANFQGLAEKIGDTAAAVASLKLASDVSGVALDTVGAASVRLTASLSKTDDESKAVGKAINALGLNFKEFKQLSPVDQIDAVAKAMNGFADGSEKTAVAVALFGKAGADLIPFLNDLANGSERQTKLTSEQIKQADDYSKSTARLKSEFESLIQFQSVQAIPTLTQVQGILVEIAKDQAVIEVATGAVSVAMKGAIVTFQTLAVVGSDVAFVFKTLGDSIRAYFAVAERLVKFDVKGAKEIGRLYRENSEERRASLDRFQSRVMQLGQTPYMDDETRRLLSRGNAANNPPRPRINVAGLAEGDNGAKLAAAAKAKLQLDLEQIKSVASESAGIYAGAEKVMEGLRAAGLLDEREYYAAKRHYLQENNRIQIEALEAENERRNQEKLDSTEALNRDREVLKNQAEIAKLRGDLWAQGAVLNLQETASIKAKDAALKSLIQAQDEYLSSIQRGFMREREGFGAGNQARSLLSGIGQIEDRYGSQRQELENQRSLAIASSVDGKLTASQREHFEVRLGLLKEYERKALETYRNHYEQLTLMQQQWQYGASEALANYYTDAQNIAAQTEALFTNAFKGMEDALVSFVTTGKLDFKSLANSIVADITRIIIKQQISNAIGVGGGSGGSGDGGGWLGTLIGAGMSYFGGGSFSAFDTSMAGSTGGITSATVLPDILRGGRANGGPVMPNSLYEVNENGPEMLEMGGRQYLMTGNQAGEVIPNGGGATNNYYLTVAAPANGSRATAMQWGKDAARSLQLATSRNG